MYIPAYYKNENLEEVKEFLKANSFGILISMVDGKLWGTHIPLELEVDPNGNEVIYGHVSKANQQWKDLDKNEEVLLIFNGPHAYVSSSWYTIEEVPTWNYIAVHVYGQLQIIEEEELRYALKKLVDKYEANMKHPIRIEELSDRTMRQIKGIVGFKITITDIQAAYKLSQTRSEDDHKTIVDELDNADGSLSKEVSKLMKGRRNVD